jgi:hypothetical protein
MTEQDNTLSDRLEKARVRSNDLAASAASRTREFVSEHPVATVAGGIIIGALIAGALTRRQRPISRAVADQTAARLTRLATMGAELALGYAARAATASKDGVEQIGEKGAEAGHKVVDLAEIALTTLRSAGEAALHRLTQRDHD